MLAQNSKFKGQSHNPKGESFSALLCGFEICLWPFAFAS